VLDRGILKIRIRTNREIKEREAGEASLKRLVNFIVVPEGLLIGDIPENFRK
jgi:hypothetical protein